MAACSQVDVKYKISFDMDGEPCGPTWTEKKQCDGTKIVVVKCNCGEPLVSLAVGGEHHHGSSGITTCPECDRQWRWSSDSDGNWSATELNAIHPSLETVTYYGGPAMDGAFDDAADSHECEAEESSPVIINVYTYSRMDDPGGYQTPADARIWPKDSTREQKVSFRWLEPEPEPTPEPRQSLASWINEPIGGHPIAPRKWKTTL